MTAPKKRPGKSWRDDIHFGEEDKPLPDMNEIKNASMDADDMNDDDDEVPASETLKEIIGFDPYNTNWDE